MPSKIGVYPGTFDPIHAGHMAFARETQRVLKLDKVIFLPEANPRGKVGITSLHHRTALVRAALGAETGFSVLNLASVQFTVGQTLPELSRLFGDARMTLLLGSDIARSLPYGWPGLDLLLARMDLAIGIRDGDSAHDLDVAMQEVTRVQKTQVRYQLIATGGADVASSQIRCGLLGLDQLHPAVASYIRQNQLYASS